jgi:tetratricopeptide (TPR) repeat protein
MHLATARLRWIRRSQTAPYGLSPMIVDEARRAVAAYERALAAPGPDDAELHFRAILAADYVDQRDSAGCTACRDMYEAQAKHAEGFFKADPRDPRGKQVAFLACVALSKLGAQPLPDAEKHLRKATEYYAAYRRTLDEGDSHYVSEMATAYSNEAELRMALGDLETAIRYYQTAADINPAEPLNHYGLAVAYDRSGEWGKAYASMREALLRDPQIGALDRDTVFFVPDGDIFYYKALARYTLGIRDGGGDHLELAATLFRRFLERERTGRWHARARDHLRELEQKLKR